MRKTIAIDFDGCLCENKYPSVGQPHWDVINRAKEEKKNGAGLILWTCREGKLLDEAVAVCKEWGLHFDAVNESLQEWIEAFGTCPRKIGASEYWDDKAVVMPEKDFITLEEAKGLCIGTPVWLKYDCIYGFHALVHSYKENGMKFVDAHCDTWFAPWSLYGSDWKLYI